MKKRASILQKLVHFLTAFSVLMKGLSKLEHPEGYWPVIALFFASAVYIVTITLLHGRLHAHERLLTASVYAIEAIVTATVARLYAAEGKQLLPWFFALAAVMFLIALTVHLVKTRRGNAPHPG